MPGHVITVHQLVGAGDVPKGGSHPIRRVQTIKDTRTAAQISPLEKAALAEIVQLPHALTLFEKTFKPSTQLLAQLEVAFGRLYYAFLGRQTPRIYVVKKYESQDAGSTDESGSTLGIASVALDEFIEFHELGTTHYGRFYTKAGKSTDPEGFHLRVSVLNGFGKWYRKHFDKKFTYRTPYPNDALRQIKNNSTVFKQFQHFIRLQYLQKVPGFANVVTAAYVYEEDDMHKGNFGIFRDRITGQWYWAKIDQDMSFWSGVSSDKKGARIFTTPSKAHPVTKADLEDFPILRDAKPWFWFTNESAAVPLTKPFDEKKYNKADETFFRRELAHDWFIDERTLSYIRILLMPIEHVSQTFIDVLDPEYVDVSARLRTHATDRLQQFQLKLLQLHSVRNKLQQFHAATEKLDTLNEDLAKNCANNLIYQFLTGQLEDEHQIAMLIYFFSVPDRFLVSNPDTNLYEVEERAKEPFKAFANAYIALQSELLELGVEATKADNLIISLAEKQSLCLDVANNLATKPDVMARRLARYNKTIDIIQNAHHAKATEPHALLKRIAQKKAEMVSLDEQLNQLKKYYELEQLATEREKRRAAERRIPPKKRAYSVVLSGRKIKLARRTPAQTLRQPIANIDGPSPTAQLLLEREEQLQEAQASLLDLQCRLIGASQDELMMPEIVRNNTVSALIEPLQRQEVRLKAFLGRLDAHQQKVAGDDEKRLIDFKTQVQALIEQVEKFQTQITVHITRALKRGETEDELYKGRLGTLLRAVANSLIRFQHDDFWRLLQSQERYEEDKSFLSHAMRLIGEQLQLIQEHSAGYSALTYGEDYKLDEVALCFSMLNLRLEMAHRKTEGDPLYLADKAASILFVIKRDHINKPRIANSELYLLPKGVNLAANCLRKPSLSNAKRCLHFAKIAPGSLRVSFRVLAAATLLASAVILVSTLSCGTLLPGGLVALSALCKGLAIGGSSAGLLAAPFGWHYSRQKEFASRVNKVAAKVKAQYNPPETHKGYRRLRHIE